MPSHARRDQQAARILDNLITPVWTNAVAIGLNTVSTEMSGADSVLPSLAEWEKTTPPKRGSSHYEANRYPLRVSRHSDSGRRGLVPRIDQVTHGVGPLSLSGSWP
jgi:hypothetical protein